MLTRRKLALGILAALYGATTAHVANAQSQNFIYKPFGLKPLSEAAVPDWEIVRSQHTPWVNDGGVYNCSAWSPPVNLVNLDENFTQSRTCSQSQARTRVDELYSARLDQTRFEGPFGEAQVVSVEESQPSVGTRDFITGVREDSFVAWAPVGGFYGCAGWTPDPSTVDFGDNFTQQRDCSWDERRNRNVFNTWQSGLETYLRTDVEDRTVPYVDSRASVGTFRDWQPTASTFTSWQDIGVNYGFTSWTPAPSTQPSDFTQSRDFKRDQNRMEQFREQDQVTTDYRNIGAPVLRVQTVDRDESRNVDVAYTPWAEVNRSAYTSWAPLPTTQTSGYSQNRNYTLTEERERAYTASGDGQLLTATESRDTLAQVESRPVSVAFTSWTESGGNYDCATWAPARDTVGVDVDFTQTRVCKQDEVRDRVYATGGSELNRIEEGRTLTPTQSRGQTGVGSWVANASSFTAWVNEGARFGFAEWSPEASNQTTDFVQTRGFSQKQTRNEQVRERDVHTNTLRNVGATIKRDKVITGTESRAVAISLGSWNDTTRSAVEAWAPLPSTQTTAFTQTSGYTQNQSRVVVLRAPSEIFRFTDTRSLVNQVNSRPVTVSFSGWANSGSIKNCGSWSPATNTVGVGESYTQTRECDQSQVRNRIYAADGATIKTLGESRTIKVNDTQSATGVGSWEATSSTFTSYVLSGSRYGFGSYTPAPSTQVTNFTQTRTYKQDRKRNEQERERDVHSGTIRNVGSPIERISAASANGNESRTVAVSFSGWSTTRNDYNCTGWTPATNTQGSGVSFTQSRVCKDDQTRNRIYKVGTTTLSTQAETRTVNDTKTQAATGVGSWEATSSTFTSWVNSGSRYDYSAYSAAASSQTSNYSQSRTYKQNQSRNEQLRERDIHSGAIRNVGSTVARSQTINGSESRSVAVSVSGWSNVSTTGHTAWTPTAYTETSNFTQARTYAQNQKRTFTHKVGSTTIHDFDATRQLSGQTQSRTVAVSFSGWSTTRNDYNCTGWTPATNTQGSGVSFTQSRVCKDDQTRNRIYKTGASTLSTKAEARTINDTKTQAATGVGSWVATTSTFTSWANSGSRYDYTAYSPAPSTQTGNFTQSRTYKQNQTRNEQRRERDSIGGSIRNTGSPIARSQTVSGSDSQTVTVTWSSWTNSGGIYSCGGYTPSNGNQTSNYTQTRSCKQNQTRSRIYKVGSSTISTMSESQTVNVNDSRTISVSVGGWANTTTSAFTGFSPGYGSQTSNYTQSRTYTQSQSRLWTHKAGSTTVHSRSEGRNLTGQSQSRTITVSNALGGWSGNGYGYGTYTPAPTTQTTTFTQSRPYKRDRVRTYTHKSGTTTVHTRGVTEVSNLTETRSVTVSWSGWSNSGAIYSCGAYNNAYGTQTSNYTQTRSCKQNQVRTRSYSVGGSASESRTINVNNSRTVAVTVGGWSNTSTTGFTGWTPSASTQTANFTQNRTYTQAQRRVWTHKVGTTTVYNRNEDRNLTNQNQSQTVAVSWSGWTNYSWTYGAWAVNTTTGAKSRYAYNWERRTRAYKVGSSTIHSAVETRNTSSIQYVTVTGTTYGSWQGWVNNGSVHSCTAYSPATSTVASGTNFTQSRTCIQPKINRRTRTNTLSDGSTFRISDQTATNYNPSVTQTRTATGTKAVANCSGTYFEEESNDYGEDMEYFERWDYPDGGFYWVEDTDRSGSSTGGTRKTGAYYFGALIGEYNSSSYQYIELQLCIN